MHTWNERIVALVEEHFLDRGFLSTPEWAAAAGELRRLDAGLPDTDLQAAGQAILDRLPLSHVQLLSPAVVRAAAAQSGGAIPDVLRIQARSGVGWRYVKLPSFQLPAFTIDAFRAALRDLPADDVVVLDLRLNAGGSLSETGLALGLLLRPDLAFARTRSLTDGPERVVHPFPEAENVEHAADVAAVAGPPARWHTPTDGTGPLPNRIVVVTGPRCYSCGEVFAQALLESGRAGVVGLPSAGAVVAGRDYELPGGWQLLLPFATIESGSGATLEGVGVQPETAWETQTPDTDALPAVEIDAIARL